MEHSVNLRTFFVMVTILVIGTVSITKIGTIDAHSVLATAAVLIPAIVVMGFLGQKIGEIMDNPKNEPDAPEIEPDDLDV